jgi:hypothetical protein
MTTRIPAFTEAFPTLTQSAHTAHELTVNPTIDPQAADWVACMLVTAVAKHLEYLGEAVLDDETDRDHIEKHLLAAYDHVEDALPLPVVERGRELAAAYVDLNMATRRAAAVKVAL